MRLYPFESWIQGHLLTVWIIRQHDILRCTHCWDAIRRESIQCNPSRPPGLLWMCHVHATAECPPERRKRHRYANFRFIHTRLHDEPIHADARWIPHGWIWKKCQSSHLLRGLHRLNFHLPNHSPQYVDCYHGRYLRQSARKKTDARNQEPHLIAGKYEENFTWQFQSNWGESSFPLRNSAKGWPRVRLNWRIQLGWKTPIPADLDEQQIQSDGDQD